MLQFWKKAGTRNTDASSTQLPSVGTKVADLRRLLGASSLASQTFLEIIIGGLDVPKVGISLHVWA